MLLSKCPSAFVSQSYPVIKPESFTFVNQDSDCGSSLVLSSTPVSKEQKRFKVNGAITEKDKDTTFMVEVENNNNAHLYKLIEYGSYVTLWGPRASGKSTIMEQSTPYFRKRGYIVIKTSLQGIVDQFTTEEIF